MPDNDINEGRWGWLVFMRKMAKDVDGVKAKALVGSLPSSCFRGRGKRSNILVDSSHSLHMYPTMKYRMWDREL